MEKKLDYHKNKENKFLFFLFQLQNQGVPVNEIYEREGIKDMPTSRFAEIMGDDQAVNQSSLLFSFYSDDSYDPIDVGPDPAVVRQKPQNVPRLDLERLPEYESSDEEEEEANPRPHMTSQDYEQSMKYIDNFYSKHQPVPTRGSDDAADDYLVCQLDNGSSLLLLDKDDRRSLVDEDFCYSVDKPSKRKSPS